MLSLNDKERLFKEELLYFYIYSGIKFTNLLLHTIFDYCSYAILISDSLY